MKCLRAFPIILIGCVILGLSNAPAGEPAGKKSKPCLVISGTNSHIAERKCCRVTSAAEWARLWQIHKGETPADNYDSFHDPLTLPTVDFDAYMVVAVFRGKGENSAGLEVEGIYEETDRKVLRFNDKSYQTNEIQTNEISGASQSESGSNVTTCYGFFVVPRSTKVLLVEENVQNMIGAAPVWKELARFRSDRAREPANPKSGH